MKANVGLKESKGAPETGSDAPRRRVIFVNRYFYPDQSATAQILSDVAFAMARTGREVRIITSRLTYENVARLDKAETIDGVDIKRVSTTGFGRANLLGRAVDYASFYISATLTALIRVKNGDVLVAKTDPPLLSVPLGLAARLKGAALVNWLQDIYPEVAAELGVGFAKGPPGRLLRSLRNRSLKRARMNISLGRRMTLRLEAAGVKPSRIQQVHNFVADETITPSQTRSLELRREWGLTENDFVIGYSGNLGRAHDLDTMLGAAELLRNTPSFKFLFIGGGKLRDTLSAEIEARGLTNVLLKPYQSRAELSVSLNLPDIHWLSLRPELEGLIVPSKLYGIAAAGRPMIFIGDPDGEVGRLADEFSFGLNFRPGDSSGVAHTIELLSQSPGRMESMATAARAFLERSGTKAYATSLWRELLSDLDAVKA